MKKVVISKLKVVSVSQRKPIALRGVLGVAEHVQSEELALVSGAVAEDKCLGDLTAFDELRQTEQLAELTSQIDLVAFVSDEVDIAFASVKHA